MNFVKNTIIILSAAFLLASCGESAPKGSLTQFDACNCATVDDMNSPDYAKCKELRKDTVFEADYQRCKIAMKSGITDTSRVTIQSADKATNLQAAGDGNYNINVESSYLTWRGENIVGKKHKGTLNVKRGVVNISGGEITGGEIVIDMNSLTNTDLTGNEKLKLEGHLKSSDFFDTGKFGEAVFSITSGTKKNAINYDVTGNLTIKGITRDLKCTLVVAPNGDGINVGGGFVFDRSQYDVRYGSDKFFENLGNNLIRNEVIVTVNLCSGSCPPPPPTTKEVTYEDAYTFLDQQTNSFGGVIVDGYTNSSMGTKIHTFLVTKGNQYCVYAISEIKLEIIAADCGGQTKFNDYYDSKAMD